MGKFKEYDRYDALGLAGLIEKKDVTPSELCEEAIDRIERINPSINAVIYRMFDAARKSAGEKKSGGPFAGVPFLLKDLLTAYAGVPLSMGCKAFRNYIPSQDSELMKRYKAAGMVFLGEHLHPSAVYALALILGGILLTQIERRSPVKR